MKSKADKGKKVHSKISGKSEKKRSVPDGLKLKNLEKRSKRIKVSDQKSTKLQDDDVKDPPQSYHLVGFPSAFQIWLYECMPSLAGKFCILEDDGIPRMNNWSYSTSPKFVELERNVFTGKFKVQKIFPTEQEKNQLNLKGFFQ
ncbi:hypothetical protein PanWU01x14_180480 [Parasponia andersonii]|uniref:Ulp1 protease family, C-terminal catalytic domain containing protein n=1 Tax=Parasponia andersonii TaxID=3476 RepID=A0A2P5C6K0_PARAD|nr:hypothetical protein PanWU01x14_180480 [Parasponia andersonii]